jgi:hypothetical protein
MLDSNSIFDNVNDINNVEIKKKIKIKKIKIKNTNKINIQKF